MSNYCSNCGTSITPSINYCSNCGTKVSHETAVKIEEKPKEKPKISAESTQKFKPKFVFLYSLLSYYFKAFFMLFFVPVWAGGFFGGLFHAFVPVSIFEAILNHAWVQFLIQLLPQNISVFINFKTMPFISVGLIAAFFMWVVVPFLALSYQYLTYRNTVYHIFEDKVEYREGFLSVENKVLRLNRVLEVHERRGLWQRFFGLGSIYLELPASGVKNGSWWEGSRNGIQLQDLENPNEAYILLRGLVDQSTQHRTV